MQFSFVHPLVSFLGALLILIASIGQQLHKINPRGTLYNWLNAIGSAIPGWMAMHPWYAGMLERRGLSLCH